MSHATFRQWIDDLVADELPAAQQVQLEEHLSGCEACRVELDDLRALRAALRGLATVPVPVALERQLGHALDIAGGATTPPRRPWYRTRTWLGAAAVLAVALAAAWSWRAQSGSLPSAVLADLDRYRVGTLGPTAAADAGALQADLARSLPFRVRVIDLRMMGFEVVAGRVHRLRGRPAALVVYRGPDGRVLLCEMFPGRIEELPLTETRSHRGFTFRIYRQGARTTVLWQEGSVLCALASDAPAEEVIALAFEKAML